MREVIIVGAGGHAVSVAETVLAHGYHIKAFVTESPERASLLGAPVVTPDTHPEVDPAIVLVLAIGDNSQRQRAWEHYSQAVGEARLPTVIHPSASVSKLARIQGGALILQGAVVGAAAQVGRGCLINSGAVLEHETVLEDFASLAPRAVTGGRVRIGTRSAISIGATVAHGVSIGADTVIGAASLVHEDVPDNVVAYGIPARIVRTRATTDPYLTVRSSLSRGTGQINA